MPYDIELLSIGENVDSLLQRAADDLNGIQSQFRFHLPSPDVRESALTFQRETYETSELWTFLQEQRQRFGGHRLYIIAFVNKPLKSEKYTRLFGSHQADKGLAVVTMKGAGQYVKEETRYISYFLTRYSISFANPFIRAHTDDARKHCYFHLKEHRPDIRLSMDSGALCDQCKHQLDNPPPNSVAHRLSADEYRALERMRALVSESLPNAIVMKGGGAKGLAFAGALLELEKHFSFDRHVGTSAGAIAAVLLAAKYTPTELVNLLREKDFRDFKDASLLKLPINLAFSWGCYPGETLRLWVDRLLADKKSGLGDISMKALNNGALVYASRPGAGTIPFDSEGDRGDTTAAFAVRCSASIPFFFIPVKVDGQRVYDGGLRNNFPLTRFLADHPPLKFHCALLG